jgi:transcriptional regulator GlxA family with amidase domain
MDAGPAGPDPFGPGSGSGRSVLRSVAVLLPGPARALEVVTVSEIFGGPGAGVAEARSPLGEGPSFELVFAAATPGVPIRLGGTATVTPTVGLDRVADADLVFVAPPGELRPAGPALVEAIRAAVDGGGLVVSADTGVFLLAEAGLLDGRPATTHWRLTDRFRRAFPRVSLVDTLYVDAAPVYTAAGGTAIVDLCLHLVATYLGATAAAALGRQILVGAHRTGRFRQLRERPVRPRSDDGLGDLLEWAARHLDEDLSLPRLASRVFMSRRSFSRRFRAVTGTTPYAWVIDQRLRHARELLEDPNGPGVEEVAARAGFGTAAALRQHFRRAVGCTPTEYRGRFAYPAPRSANPAS